MYDILKQSVFWKIWQTSFLGVGEGSDDLEPALLYTTSLDYAKLLL